MDKTIINPLTNEDKPRNQVNDLTVDLISYNGNAILQKQVPYYQFSKCMIYGGGVMETSLAKENKIAYFDHHYRRLTHSLMTLYPKVSLDFDEKTLAKHISEILIKKKHADLSQISIKVFIDNHQPKCHYLIETSPYQKRRSEIIIEKECLILDISCRKHKLTVYSTSYLSGALNKSSEHVKDHFVYNRDGKIIEAAKANVALISKETLYLVNEEENILPGITQHLIRENYHRWFKKLKVTNGFSFDDFKKADEVLYLNSLSMCLPIRNALGVSFKSHFAPIINQFLFDW